MDNSNISTDQLAKSIYAIKLGDENYDENLKKSEEFKTLGNELLNQNKFLDSLTMFSNAITLNIETKKNSIYYSNRALVHFKMENYGLAVDDANKAIEEDNLYLKGHYRRASANLLLGNFDQAIIDLEFLYSKLPLETNLVEKISKAKKERKKKKFILAMQSDESQTSCLPKVSTIAKCLESTSIEQSYSGETYPEDHKINSDWIKKIMEEMKDNKYIHKKYLVQMIAKVKEIYAVKETLVDVDIPDTAEFSVCGDVHGQYYDLLNIFKINGYPSLENPYLFNGDFVDRGSFSVEIMITLLAWKILLPDHFHMARGNHETRNLNKIYGFQGEVKKKYDDDIYECFCELFCALPLGHILNKKVLVVHGGLFSKDGIKLDEIKKIDRFREPPEQGVMCEILWSDPCKMKGRQPSKRGVGLCFGPDIAEKFLEDNGLELLVRSHEVKDEGYEIEADGKVCTIFSAPNYCDQMGNKGALIRFKGNTMKLDNFVQFSSVPHPNVPPMKYANPWMFF